MLQVAFAVVLMFALLVGIDLILAFPVMWTWDVAMPALFHLPTITYWQAFSLLILAGLLIKSTTVANSSK